MCAFRPIRPKARRDRRFGEHLHQYYAEVVAAIHDADSILILGPGEPTANLDSHHGRETMRLLRRLAKEEKRSVIIVSHDERIKAIADRVLWLEDGEFKSMVEMVIDPVCGMALDKENAPAQTEVDGQVVYFCANGCRDEFLIEPTRYVMDVARRLTQEEPLTR